MNEFVFTVGGLTCRVICDEDAPPVVDSFVNGLGSKFLCDIVTTPHRLNGREVLMRDHINLVMTLEHPGRRLISFIFAELEEQNHLARLHILYTLRSYRNQGYAKTLLPYFDQVLAKGEYTSVILAPASNLSLRLFQKHQLRTTLSYELCPPGPEVLAQGDIECD